MSSPNKMKILQGAHTAVALGFLSHPELFSLTTAHIDCDAFYASVEKRDNPKFKG